MPRYTFTFKKDDMFVEFTTADKDVVERQFQIWVADADNYAKSRKGKPSTVTNVVQPQVKEEQEASQPKEEPPSKPVVIEQKIEEKKVEETVIISESVQTEEKAPEEPKEEVIDKASTLLRTINTIQNPPEEEISQEVSESVAVFEEVLEKSIENPTFEPVKAQDPVFLNLFKSKNTADKFHYLMITAYYLSEFEKMERFSLKLINAKLMQNLNEVIDHATLQEAINQNLVELVPDLTGSSEVAEYRLTRAGEEFFVKI